MHVELRSPGLNLSGAAADTIRARLATALRRFAGKVERVDAYLGDVNGPRGGVDKRCLLVVRLPAGATVAVEERAAGLSQLLNRAVQRARFAVSRALGHLRTLRGRRAARRRPDGDDPQD